MRVAPLAAGAQQLGEELARAVDAPVAVMEGHDQPAPPPPAVLVMTRGSVMDRPPGPVGAIVLPDLDALSRRADADAPEDALRLAMALSSWGADGAAEVVVRTDDPRGIVVQSLVRWDPGGFWRAEVERRTVLGFPPVRHAVAVDDRGTQEVAATLADLVPVDALLGPLPTGDGWRRHLLLVDDRAAVLEALRPAREAWSRRGVEVRVDVDPVTLG